MEGDIQLVPITAEDKDGGGRLLPAVRDRVVQQIEAYLVQQKAVNISEISRQLGISWEAAERYVVEVTERWRKEDTKVLQQVRRRLTKVSQVFIDRAEAKAAEKMLSLSEMQETISMFKDIMSLTKLEENPVETAADASKMVSVHFNNLSITPSMAKELEKVKEDGNTGTGHTGS